MVFVFAHSLIRLFGLGPGYLSNRLLLACILVFTLFTPLFITIGACLLSSHQVIASIPLFTPPTGAGPTNDSVSQNPSLSLSPSLSGRYGSKPKSARANCIDIRQHC